MTRMVVTFHDIGDHDSVLAFPVHAFREFVETLARQRAPVVSFDRLAQLEHGVTLTFDDGMRSVFDHALPVLRDHGFPAHLFLATGAVGPGRRWEFAPAHTPGAAMLDWHEVGQCQRECR